MSKPSPPSAERAIRATVSGGSDPGGLRDAILERAHEIGVQGWARDQGEGAVKIHAEGPAGALDRLLDFLAGRSGEGIEVEEVKPEGHEQFAARGVSAGRFEVAETEGGSGRSGYELRLEVSGAVRAWALAKEPAMDPAVKRMAFGIPDPVLEPGPAWDQGEYEQGGRVPWPEAIERGHAVFVLHGERLRGGFALQRIRPGARPQWLLIKRADEYAERGPG